MSMEPRKQAIIDALAKFINQRGGLEFGNYGDVKAFRAEQRSITRDGAQARTLLDAVKWRDSITADALIKAAQSAYSGRLTIKTDDDKQLQRHVTNGDHYNVRIDYCTGQYFPTEYRRAVCAVLASALWEYTREHCMPPAYGYRVESWSQLGKGRTRHELYLARASAERQLRELGGSDYGSIVELYRLTSGVSAGDWLRAHFAKEFGRGIASRWFN